jgi:hypothetical protein
MVTTPEGRPTLDECFRPGCQTCYPVAVEHEPVVVEAEPEKRVRSGTKLQQTKDAIMAATGLHVELDEVHDDTPR